jgi:transcriptional antiterminator NusG
MQWNCRRWRIQEYWLLYDFLIPDYVRKWRSAPNFTKGEVMWYAIQVNTGKEDTAIALIKQFVQSDFYEDVFVCEKQMKRKFKGEWKLVSMNMFPGYIFVITDCVQLVYESLREVPQFTKLLKTGEHMTSLYHNEEMWLSGITGHNHMAEMSLGVIEGDRLIVKQGALLGKEGIVKKIDRHRRIAVVEVEMFGQTIDMRLGLEVISKI